jgi:hypothetical protein
MRGWENKALATLIKKICLGLILTLFIQMVLVSDLRAFTIIENKMFSEGPYLFKVEVQVYGRGSAKKNPMIVNSVKVKIKNDRASSKILTVKSIRAYIDPIVYKDLETKAYPISPSQWVTKYYRLPRDKRPLLGEQGFIQIVFDGFAIHFNPRERKFQGPLK